MASGEDFLTSAHTAPTIFLLVAMRSSRLMPGLRAMPLVMTTTSDPTVSA